MNDKSKNRINLLLYALSLNIELNTQLYVYNNNIYNKHVFCHYLMCTNCNNNINKRILFTVTVLKPL